jgi:hypothetical protein
MSKITIFIQAHGRAEIAEAELAAIATIGELHDILAENGITVAAETVIFIDEAEQALAGERHHPVHGLKHGSRIHVGHCKEIAVTVHFHHKTEKHNFPPGARVRAVKQWAVHKYQMPPKDAAEHVLQICDTTNRPASDTPIHQLVHGHDCVLCFNLVPEKRVEG